MWDRVRRAWHILRDDDVLTISAISMQRLEDLAKMNYVDKTTAVELAIYSHWVRNRDVIARARSTD